MLMDETLGEIESHKPKILDDTFKMVDEYRHNQGSRILRSEKIPLDQNQEILRKIFADNGTFTSEHIDVYNPSGEFVINGETYTCGRAETRGSETNSTVIFFKKTDGKWEPLPNFSLRMQDPSVSIIGDEIIISGVKLILKQRSGLEKSNVNQTEDNEIISYKTVFFKGKSVEGLVEFTEGPDRMKDIRLVELADHRIGVYTRPTGGEADRGQIGFTIIDSLDQLTEQVIKEAPLLSFRFPKGEWGGANQATLLPDGRIFVLAHRAYFDSNNDRHYKTWGFIHNPLTGEIEDVGILGERKDFPEGEAKAKDLKDVVFSSSIKFSKVGYILRVGAGDTEVDEIEVENPEFIKRLGLHNSEF